MVTGRAELELLLPGCLSLKDKRRILRSLLERLRNRYHLAAAEVGAEGQWQRAVVGLACVTNDRAHARRMLDEAVRFAEADGRCEVIVTRLEVD
ncbi:MAG: DUF503 domain-containing protein [Patescibacteria group bacterium]